MTRWKSPLPESFSIEVKKTNGTRSSISRTSERNMNPSISPIMISETMAWNRSRFTYPIASSGEATAVTANPAPVR